MNIVFGSDYKVSKTYVYMYSYVHSMGALNFCWYTCNLLASIFLQFLALVAGINKANSTYCLHMVYSGEAGEVDSCMYFVP